MNCDKCGQEVEFEDYIDNDTMCHECYAENCMISPSEFFQAIKYAQKMEDDMLWDDSLDEDD